MAWLRDPDEIYRRSFAIVAEEADLFAVPEDMGTSRSGWSTPAACRTSSPICAGPTV